MTVKIKELLSKIENLERNINSVTSSAKEIGLSKFYTLKKDLLSFPCVSETKISFENITFNINNKLLIEPQVEFSSQDKQKVEISLLIDDLLIEKISRICNIGNNTFSFSQVYTPKISKTGNIYVLITPKDKKQIIISNIILNIFGASSDENNKKYQVVELENKYLISQLIGGAIYYKIITKNEIMLGAVDFDFFAYAKNYSFVYLTNSKMLYLLKIDNENILSLENLVTGETKFIDFNVEKISAATSGELIKISYIKNQICYVYDYENGEFSLPQKCYDYKTKNCYIFYDKFNAKFCINLNLKSGKNLLFFENIPRVQNGERLNLKFDIIISEIGAENEN